MIGKFMLLIYIAFWVTYLDVNKAASSIIHFHKYTYQKADHMKLSKKKKKVD